MKKETDRAVYMLTEEVTWYDCITWLALETCRNDWCISQCEQHGKKIYRGSFYWHLSLNNLPKSYSKESKVVVHFLRPIRQAEATVMGLGSYFC